MSRATLLRLRLALVAGLVTGLPASGLADPSVIDAQESSSSTMRPNAASEPAPQIASTAADSATGARSEDAAQLRRRKRRSLLAVSGTYAAITTWMYFAWFYDKPELPNFTFGGDRWFEDSTYAGGADKVGHMWSGYALGRLTTTLLRRGGWSPSAASIMGSSLSCALFTYVEIHDGFYYQMSPGDLAGDAAGCLLSWAMERSPALDRMFDFRVEYVSSPEYRSTFRDGDINIAEDYSGQTFLLAAHVGEMPWVRAQPAAKYLRYVDVVVGFKTRNYKPDPDPALGKLRRQTLFLGVSLNAQAIWDDVFARRRTLRRVGHGVFEVANLPYTSLPLVKATRSPDD